MNFLALPNVTWSLSMPPASMNSGVVWIQVAASAREWKTGSKGYWSREGDTKG